MTVATKNHTCFRFSGYLTWILQIFFVVRQKWILLEEILAVATGHRGAFRSQAFRRGKCKFSLAKNNNLLTSHHKTVVLQVESSHLTLWVWLGGVSTKSNLIYLYKKIQMKYYSAWKHSPCVSHCTVYDRDDSRLNIDKVVTCISRMVGWKCPASTRCGKCCVVRRSHGVLLQQSMAAGPVLSQDHLKCFELRFFNEHMIFQNLMISGARYFSA